MTWFSLTVHLLTLTFPGSLRVSFDLSVFHRIPFLLDFHQLTQILPDSSPTGSPQCVMVFARASWFSHVLRLALSLSSSFVILNLLSFIFVITKSVLPSLGVKKFGKQWTYLWLKALQIKMSEFWYQCSPGKTSNKRTIAH